MPPGSRTFKLCTGETVSEEKLGSYPNSHIIGELRYVSDEGRRVTALAVYEKSVCVEQVPYAVPPLRAELIGDARKIKCTLCIHRERWEIGKAAMGAIIDRARRNGAGS